MNLIIIAVMFVAFSVVLGAWVDHNITRSEAEDNQKAVKYWKKWILPAWVVFGVSILNLIITGFYIILQ